MFHYNNHEILLLIQIILILTNIYIINDKLNDSENLVRKSAKFFMFQSPKSHEALA